MTARLLARTIAVAVAVVISLALALARIIAVADTINLVSNIDDALDRATGLAFASDLDRAGALALVNDLDYSSALDLVHDLVYDLDKAFVNDLVHASAPIVVFIRVISIAVAIVVALTLALAKVLTFGICFVMGLLDPIENSKNNDSETHDSMSWIYFLLDEEYRQHLNDLRQYWNDESRDLCLLQQRWVIWSETRVFEIQTLWAMGRMKLEEMLGLHQLP